MVTPRLYNAEIEDTYSDDYTFVCPVRGPITQIVMVNKYKPLDRRLITTETEEKDAETT